VPAEREPASIGDEAKVHVVPDAPVPDPRLRLGGPSMRETARRAPRDPGSAAPARPSIAEQIAKLGAGMRVESGEQTIGLDSPDPRFVPYLERVKRRLQQAWRYPQNAVALRIGGDTFVIFTVNKAGTLTDVHLLEGSGIPMLDEAALRAVKDAAPYDPFPPEMGERPKNITALFQYSLPQFIRR
jgi:protein TonB